MRSIDCGEIAEANVRPLNDASGRGRISVRGWWYSSPSYSMTPVSSASQDRRRVLGEAPPRLAHLDAEPVELDAPEAAARGRACARPPDRWSSSEKFSATRTGSCHGSTVTIVPSLTRAVCPATQARNCGTFGVSW